MTKEKKVSFDELPDYAKDYMMFISIGKTAYEIMKAFEGRKKQ